MTPKSVAEIVREAERNDTFGNTVISKYVNFSLRENIEKIDAYLNSKFTSGDKDALGREKPFFNIVTAACNIWYRATDIDRKNIRIKATKAKHYVLAFVATILLQRWMNKNAFGRILNEWGRTLARYGSAVIKFIEKDGELHADVIPWNRLIVDPIDFDNNVKIEKLWLTAEQLRSNKSYDQKVVDDLLNALTTRKTGDGQTKDNRAYYIPLYEVHGKLQLSCLTDKEKDEEFVQQMHVITFLARKNNEYDDYSLVKGRESKDPYFITHLIKEDGRTMAIGAVEHLFEAQWMVNHNAKQIKDHLDLASKMIFQTSDGNFVGQNALSAIEQGDILTYQMNQPLTQLNNRADTVALQNFTTQWQMLAKEITSTPDAISGGTMPSGTAYRQVAILNQESHSLFEIMTENKGLALEEMLRIYVIPHFKKTLGNSDEISAILEDHQITQLDAMYVPNEAKRRANKNFVETTLAGGVYTKEQQATDIQTETQGLQQGLNQLGNQRFFKPHDIPSKTWKDVLKDLEWELQVEVTPENTDKEATMTTLTTVLQTIASNPMILQDPNAKMLFNKIINETSVVSPIELSVKTPQMPQQPNQQVPALVGGQGANLTQPNQL
jgi:hypothetical protein